MKYYSLVSLCILVIVGLIACGGAEPTPAVQATCAPPTKQDGVVEEAKEGGAIIILERTSEGLCANEVWAIYPDGRIVAENGTTSIDETTSSEEVTTLLAEIEELGFFDLESTKHTACRECFAYEITINDDGQVKAVTAVDGGTDTPGAYWKSFAAIKRLVPDFEKE
jgi:hypothetical protein